MPRSLWRGVVSFGLIFVPVDLFTASKENALPLHLLDSRDFAPVGYQRMNKSTGKEVDWGHIVKGYEFKKGQYVALSEADFKHANVKASETIAVDTFCDLAEVPPMYFHTPYYLAPGKGGQKVYTLLRKSLLTTGKAAVGTFVMRQRQHLCLIVPSAQNLMLITLRFADEIQPFAQVKRAKSIDEPSAAELSTAKRLVQGMSGAFKPERFKDTYRADLRRRIQEKIRRNQIHTLEVSTATKSERPTAQVLDLMSALKKSLQLKSARA